MIPQIVEASKTLSLLQSIKKRKAAGEDIASFTAGEPDFPTPKVVVEEAYRAMKAGDTSYVSSKGKSDLCQTIAQDYRERLNSPWVKEENVLVTAGSKQALALLFHCLLEQGDEVIFPTPYWVSYPSLVKACNGEATRIMTQKSDGYFLTVELLEKNKTPKTKAVIFSSPANPSGQIIDLENLKNVVNWCLENKVYLIFDEIYERLCLGDKQHTSVAALIEEANSEYIFCVNACSKSMAMTGWRLGYCISHPENIKNLAAMQSQFLTCVPGFIQSAAKIGIEQSKDFFPTILEIFKQRKNLMVERLSKLKGLDFLQPEGAFYVFINLQNKIKSLKLSDDKELAQYLLDQYKLAIVPGSSFGMDGWIRLSYSTSTEEINKGLDRLEQFYTDS